MYIILVHCIILTIQDVVILQFKSYKYRKKYNTDTFRVCCFLYQDYMGITPLFVYCIQFIYSYLCIQVHVHMYIEVWSSSSIQFTGGRVHAWPCFLGLLWQLGKHTLCIAVSPVVLVYCQENGGSKTGLSTMPWKFRRLQTSWQVWKFLIVFIMCTEAAFGFLGNQNRAIEDG